MKSRAHECCCEDNACAEKKAVNHLNTVIAYQLSTLSNLSCLVQKYRLPVNLYYLSERVQFGVLVLNYYL